jgi:EmrB/QacA subfamily drug resistance transporter
MRVTGQIRRSGALATVLLVLCLTFLDTTVVSVALGDIQYDLGAGVISLQWVANGYSLPFASLMLLAGSLSDRYGRKRLMVIGIVIFCLGSVICAVAPSVGWLIAGRAVMGVGAAASEPGTLSVLRHLYTDRRERARALGFWAAASGLALALGPVVGGVLVGLADWRAVFWFNLALGAVLLAAVVRFLPESADPGEGRLDGGGFVFGALGLGALIYAGISGEQYGYGTWWIVTLFVVAGLCLVAFVFIEARVKNPSLDLRLVRKPVLGSALFAAFAVYFGIFSIFFFTALYLDLALGYSGWRLAAVFTPMAVAIVGGSLLAGRWVARDGPRNPLIAGSVVSAAGILLTRFAVTDDVSEAFLTVALIVAGLGFGIAVVPLTAAVLGHVPAAKSGMAAGATNTARQLGTVIGVAALGAVVNAHLAGDFGRSLSAAGVDPDAKEFILNILVTGGSDAAGFDIAHPPDLIKPLVDAALAAFRNGLHVALYISAGLILLGALATALVPKQALHPSAELD